MIGDNELYQVKRYGKHLVVVLKQAHRVISTSDINGGQTEELEYLVNFQSMESASHNERFTKILSLSNEAYHRQVADEILLDASKMAIMGTAANINNTVHTRETYQDTRVDAFVTAGVQSNALRAGDKTSWYEGENGNVCIDSYTTEERVVKDKGTINIILLINRTLNAGAQAKAITILNEAKTAALTELAIGSTCSEHLATGTGTDQYIVAAPLKSPQKQLTSASGHLKLGEIVGEAVRKAVLEALSIQNGLERSYTRNIEHVLKRFGFSEKILFEKLKSKMSEQDFTLLQKNKHELITEPKVVANAYAFATLVDRFNYGSLSTHIKPDILLDQAVNTALAVSGRDEQWLAFRTRIESQVDRSDVPTLDYFVTALAVGWQAKWIESEKH